MTILQVLNSISLEEDWIYAYRTLIGGACIFIFFVIRNYINSVQRKFDQTTLEFTKLIERIDVLINSITALKISNERYEERFAALNNRLLDMQKEINALQGELKLITHRQDICHHCNLPKQ